jgi:hypothetical protein
MAQLFWLSGQQLSDGNGAPYAGAKANFYDTGTTTPKATYSDAGLTAINANPVVADANGRFADIYLVAGRYKVVLTTSADVAIDTLDPVDATTQLVSMASAPATTYPFLRYHNTTDGNVYRRNAANNAWINEGGVDSLLNAASVSEVLTGMDTSKSVSPDTLAALWQRGSNIASASTLSLPATGGGVFNVTGTTTVAGISSAQGGRCVKLRFAASLTLTHDGTTFILPGGVSIVTQAGDVAEFINDAASDATGSNWRCFNYQRAKGVSVIGTPVPATVATGNYTATTANAGGFIYFGSLTGASTLSLPPAASMTGQTLTIVNSSRDHGLTIDPDGAETLDGAATRRTFGVRRVTIFSDGGQWLTLSGSYLYYSGDQTLSAAGNIAGTHDLGARPQKAWGELRCQTAEHGYVTGDTLAVASVAESDGSTTRYGILFYDDTAVRIILAQNGGFQIMHKTAGTLHAITLASWRYRMYAEAH